MMPKRKWFVLLGLLVIYILLGAGIFFNVESQEEERRLQDQREERFEIADMLEQYRNRSVSRQQEDKLYDKLTDYCGKPVSRFKTHIPDLKKWDFYHAVFFVITVVTTVGYGNIAPTTMFTRIFMIFYALIGVPMNGIVMVTLGHYFGKSFTKLYERWKKSRSNKARYDTARLGLIGQVILYLIPGFTFFIFLPAGIMVLFEGWAYDLAVYYCFVTLTTIGFGDYVAGFQSGSDFSPVSFWLYKMFLLVWIIIGLGYVVMILGFITQAMRSERLRKLEHMITHNIKRTPVRIRTELRNLLQEFLFLKVKSQNGVYKDAFAYTPHLIERSQSCPDLSACAERRRDRRQRAFSECPPTFDLLRIQPDLEMHQQNLLLKVVDALSTYGDNEEGAYHGLSDAEILASERYTSEQPKRDKRRCISDVRAPGIMGLDPRIVPSSRKLSESTSETEKSSQTLFARLRAKFTSNKDDRATRDVEADVRRGSVLSNVENRSAHYRLQTARGRPSVLSIEQESVLEQTSLADFLRAVSAVTADPDSLRSSPASPRRKLGTAGFATGPEQRRRLSLRPQADGHDSVRPPPRRFSLRPVPDENLLAPPPYCELGPRTRKFSKITSGGATQSTTVSPVQRQVNKRDNSSKDDSYS